MIYMKIGVFRLVNKIFLFFAIIVVTAIFVITEIRQAIWDIHILRFFAGVIAIYISFTSSSRVWYGYPTVIQFFLRIISFLAGIGMIWSLTLS